MNKFLSGALYRPLSRNQVETIHEKALDILERTGVGFESGLEEDLEPLEQAGADLDRASRRIRLPRKLVRQMSERAPEQVVLRSRDGQNDLDLGEHRVHIGTGGAAIRILDLESEEARASTLEDLYWLGRLVDQLQNIHFFLRPCIPTDIPASTYDLNVFHTCFRSTTKHVMAGVNTVEDLRDVLEMASLLAGDREELLKAPFLSIITSFMISPLKLSTQPTKIMLEAGRNRIPVALSGAPMAGSTAPLTMAGTLVQTHAEQLAGIALSQVNTPGAPVLYGGIPSRADLRTMNFCGGAVECGMMNGAIHQLAHHIQVPNYNSSGLTDSKIPDIQAGWEKGMTTLLGALAGSNYMHHAAGMLESMITVAYEQYVLDDEVIGMTNRVLRGIEVDEDRLALDLIDSVGPGGEFITSEHTFEHMYSEYYPGNGITDRNDRDTWSALGGLDARQRAKAKVKELLQDGKKSYIPEETEQKIRQRFDTLF
jgi:trimethylamine--corrinoid protein Co-methyltransferase